MPFIRRGIMDTLDKYPAAIPPQYADTDYLARGGRVIEMSPDELLGYSTPLELDDVARDNIDDLKRMMLAGQQIDPPSLYSNDGSVRAMDGRHRAIAAKELGLESIPVVDLRPQEPRQQSLTDTLSGYSDEALRMLQKSALDEGKADEAARYARELDQRGPAGKPRLDPKAPVAAGMAALAAQSEEAEAAPMGTLRDGIKMATRQAYHGSPHDFDKFSLTKIGTGEGAQAYGHGLYFSSSEDIARFYRDALSDSGFEYSRAGEIVDSTHALDEIGDELSFVFADDMLDPAMGRAWVRRAEQARWDGLSKQEAMDKYADSLLVGNLTGDKVINEIWDRVDELDPKRVEKGRLYTVEIPDESNMLDWDKPLSEQPEGVREFFEPLVAPMQEKTPTLNPTGETLYGWLAGGKFAKSFDEVGGDKASTKLKELGIPGITYKGATSDERNFVVFDDEHINIIQKGLVDPKLLAPMAAGAATIGYATSDFAAAESSLNATEDDLIASSERFKALRKGKRAQRLSQELERVLAPVAGPAKALMDATEVMLVGVAGGIPGYLSELTGYVRGQDLEEAKAGGEALAGKLTGTMAEALGEDWDPRNPYLQGLAKAMEQGEKEFQDAYRMLGVENSVMKKGWDQLPERAQRIITGLADLAL